MGHELLKPLRRVEPRYPPMARRFGVHGTVSVDAVIDETGAVSSAEHVEGHPVLGRAAEEAVLEWRFEPLAVDGDPVRAVVRFSFEFKPE